MAFVSISIDLWRDQELLTKVLLQEIVGTDTSVENHGGRVWRKVLILPSQVTTEVLWHQVIQIETVQVDVTLKVLIELLRILVWHLLTILKVGDHIHLRHVLAVKDREYEIIH